VQPHDDRPVVDRLELVERIEEQEQVVGDLVVGIGLERGFERAPGARLVPRAQQMHAELGPRPWIVAVDDDRAARQLGGLVEAVVARGVIACHAIDLAVGLVDLQDLADRGQEFVSAPFEEIHRGDERSCFEALRIDRQRLLNRRTRLGLFAVIERELREEQMRRDVVRVERKHTLGERARHRRVLVEHGAREADARRHPVVVHAQRRLERSRGVLLVVDLEEHLSPRGIHQDVVGSRRRRFAEIAVRVFELTDRARRDRRAHEVGGGFGLTPRQHAFERGRTFGALAKAELEQPELEGGLAGRRLGGNRCQDFFGFRVAAALDVGASAHGHRVRIAGVFEKKFYLVEAARVERAGSILERGGRFRVLRIGRLRALRRRVPGDPRRAKQAQAHAGAKCLNRQPHRPPAPSPANGFHGSG